MRYKTKDIGDEGLEVRVPVTGSWLSTELPDLELSPGPDGLTLSGRLERTGDDSFLLRGDLRGAVQTGCARCLEPALVPLEVPVTVSYVEVDEAPGGGKKGGKTPPVEDEDDADDEGDVLTFSGGVIDIGNEIRDEILLALPISAVCREDCAGICPVCGGNRNAIPCDCEERQRQVNSKLSALKDIKV